MTESKIGPRFSGMTDNNLASERKMIMNINDVNIKWPRPKIKPYNFRCLGINLPVVAGSKVPRSATASIAV